MMLERLRTWIRRRAVAAPRVSALLRFLADEPHMWRSEDRLWLDEPKLPNDARTARICALAAKLGLIQRESWHHRRFDPFVRIAPAGIEALKHLEPRHD